MVADRADLRIPERGHMGVRFSFIIWQPDLRPNWKTEPFSGNINPVIKRVVLSSSLVKYTVILFFSLSTSAMWTCSMTFTLASYITRRALSYKVGTVITLWGFCFHHCRESTSSTQIHFQHWDPLHQPLMLERIFNNKLLVNEVFFHWMHRGFRLSSGPEVECTQVPLIEDAELLAAVMLLLCNWS